MENFKHSPNEGDFTAWMTDINEYSQELQEIEALEREIINELEAN